MSPSSITDGKLPATYKQAHGIGLKILNKQTQLLPVSSQNTAALSFATTYTGIGH